MGFVYLRSCLSFINRALVVTLCWMKALSKEMLMKRTCFENWQQLMSGPYLIKAISLLMILLSLSSASCRPIMFVSPFFEAMSVIISLRAFIKMSSFVESIRSFIIAMPFLYKKMSLISSENVHMLTIDITDKAVKRAPFSLDLVMIEVKGSTRVMNSILPASPSSPPSSFRDFPKNFIILLQQASFTRPLSLLSKIPTRNLGYS